MTIGRIYHGIQMHEEKEHRKKQTAELLSKGYSPIEIASMLNVREQTILNYVKELNSGLDSTQKKDDIGMTIVSIIVALVIVIPILIWIWSNLK